MASSESSSDNEMETLQEYYQDLEPEEMISSMLGKVFDEPSEPSAKKIKLDEETFQLIETEGMVAWEPSEEEIRKYPELEYTSEEIKAIVAKMSKKQQIQFKELEKYFLLKYRQTGNMHLLYQEVRQIVREMCPLMPGNMQEAVVEARAQLQAEAKLKDVCRQLNIPVSLTTASPPVVLPTKSSPESEPQVPKEITTAQDDPKSAQAKVETAQATSSKGGPKQIVPVQVKSEGDIKLQPMLATQYLPDTILKAMEGEGDESLQILTSIPWMGSLI